MLTLTNSSWRLVGFDEEALGERLGVVADFAESGLPKFLCPLPRPGEVNLVRPTVLLLRTRGRYRRSWSMIIYASCDLDIDRE